MATVRVVKKSLIIYREVFLVFELKIGKTVSVCETDKNFAAFVNEASDRLPGFNSDWYALGDAANGAWVDIWRGA